jgi:predicted glycosyltransferase
VTLSVLIHVQWLLGIGHLQRSLRIAEALTREGASVTLVCGGPPTPELAVADVRVVGLPPVRALDARFELVDEAGHPLDDALRAARRAALLAAFEEALPDAVVIEGFPFARRAFRFELDPLILAARRVGSPVLCSVRDVIQKRDDPARDREIVARMRADFAAVLVHGDPHAIPFDASFAAAPEIADRLHYTGYVTDPPGPAAAPDLPTGEILVSGGGGSAGLRLMQAAVAARRAGCFADAPWRILAGPHLPEPAFAALRDAAPPGMVVERFRSDFPALLRRCRVSVSQAGYNTALDILAAHVRSVLVPFADGHETEQLVRAEFLAARGVCELLREDRLSPQALAAAIARAASRPPATIRVDTDGARRSARLIVETIRR